MRTLFMIFIASHKAKSTSYLLKPLNAYYFSPETRKSMLK